MKSWYVPLAITIILSTTGRGAPQAPDDCRDWDRIVYEEIEGPPFALPGEGVAGAVEVQVLEADEPGPVQLERQPSPQGTAFLVQESPDTTQPGPWDTSVYVYGNEARSLALRIDLRNHATYGVSAKWINEKLLFIQVWLGRIAATDLILDVEQLAFVYAENADHGSLILPCSEKQLLP